MMELDILIWRFKRWICKLIGHSPAETWVTPWRAEEEVRSCCKRCRSAFKIKEGP